MYFKQKKTVKEAAFASYVTKVWLQNRYPTSGESVVASNVYLNHFDETNIERRIQRDTQNPLRRYKLGTIASVDVRYKGQEYIIRAMGKLKKRGIIIDYDLVGAGNPCFLKKIAEKEHVIDQVHFLGVKLHEDIWTWLDSIDIYAQPSKQEGLPRAVIEAMNRGCMAIGSDIAGLPELLEPDMMFHHNKVKQICSVIEGLINERSHEHRIRRNYEKSFEFEIHILDDRRNRLFEKYKQSIIEQLS